MDGGTARDDVGAPGGPAPFTAAITAEVIGEATHPDPELLTPEERAHLGLDKGERQ